MSSAGMMAIRRRILGVALRNVRTSRDRTLDDLAKILQCAPERLSGYERGQQDLSLPELETLAAYLHVPAPSLLSGELPSGDGGETQTLQVRLLRDRIIGAHMGAARRAAEKSLDDTAAQLDCSIAEMQAYERGQSPIPVARFLMLSEFLSVPWEQLAGQPRSEGDQAEDAEAGGASPVDLGHLSPEALAFLSDPEHLAYVKVAMALSRLAKEQVLGFAEALMDIGAPE